MYKRQGYTSSKGLQLPLTGIEEGENFAIQMNFQKSDFSNIDLNQPVHFALQGGIDNAMYGKTLVVQYYNEDGNWEELPSTTYSEEGPLSARLRFTDYNWNQSSSELAETSFLQAEGDTVSLRFVPKNGTLENKTGDAVFRLDDVGFGKSAIGLFTVSSLHSEHRIEKNVVSLQLFYSMQKKYNSNSSSWMVKSWYSQMIFSMYFLENPFLEIIFS